MLVYDGECPVCSAYTRALAIRRDAGPLTLIDARTRPDLVATLSENGIDIDEGFVCSIAGRHYVGADALAVLALISGRTSAANRLNYAIFRHPRLARLAYPLMRTGRNALLRARGIGRINR